MGWGWQSSGDGCTVQKFRVWGTGEASLERLSRSTRTRSQLERSVGKSQSAPGMGCVQGPSHSATPLPGRGLFWGRREERANYTSLTGQSLHTHTHTRTHGEGTHVAGSFPLDMLTCRQATPLPCRKGRRGCKGHGGGQLKREAVGRGIEAPGGESRAKTKRKDGRWTLKTEQKIVNSIQGRGRRGSHQHTACSTHQEKVLSTPCPSWGSRLA